MKRKLGTEKAYPQKIRKLMANKEPLTANRRGIVPNFGENEKPCFTAEELVENRRRGISYSSIGKKLGIDNTKDEVLCVFEVMKKCDDTLPDVTQEDHPMVKSYPTPLWYMFNSELDIVAKASVPDVQQILATHVQERLSSRLGERACDMLTAYIEVGQILKEELSICMGNCSTSTYLGKANMWTNDLPKKVLSSTCDVFSCIAKSSLQHTKDVDMRNSVGRCQCGGVKVLKFVWKSGEDTVPSFFWGCTRYRAHERYQHDRAVSFRSASLHSVLSNNHYLSKISGTDLCQLERLLLDQMKLYREREVVSEDDISKVNRIYGGTPEVCTNEGLAEYINGFISVVSTEIKGREQKAGSILPNDDVSPVREDGD